MKIKTEQIDRLVDRLMKAYQAKELKIITRNFHEEEVIEEEARQMLASHAGQVKEMDHYKMFLLIKQKLALKKGFVL
ncbi:MAG: DUF507 family protein [Deltaproteobacteria bacterium]|nr:DUF507 family protein [Deltaproteobacteria bacterium]